MRQKPYRSLTVQRYIQYTLSKIRKLQRVYHWVTLLLGLVLVSIVVVGVIEFQKLSMVLSDVHPAVKLKPLGRMHVTMYSHRETGGRTAATGYVLKPNVDSGKVCAISRELWQKDIRQGDILYIPHLNLWLVAVDTMAINNPTTKRPQLKWVDIYESDIDKVDAFGLLVCEVYKLQR